MSIELATTVEDFWAARARGEFFPQAYADRLTLDEAYRIQLALIDRRVAAGERQIGWKVGLTAKPIQEQFGFHEPVFACILETQPSGHMFGATELINPGFETELCMRLGRGLEGIVSLEQVRAAVDVIHPAFEIIETRGDLAKQIALALADNGQQRSVVLGNPMNSIRWLAEKLGQHGRRLRPGDIIMTGSFVRQFPLQAGDIAVAEFSGIGRVEVRIAKA